MGACFFLNWIIKHNSFFLFLLVLVFQQDHVRTESYRDFMYDNMDVFKDKVSVRIYEAHKWSDTFLCVEMG